MHRPRMFRFLSNAPGLKNARSAIAICVSLYVCIFCMGHAENIYAVACSCGSMSDTNIPTGPKSPLSLGNVKKRVCYARQMYADQLDSLSP